MLSRCKQFAKKLVIWHMEKLQMPEIASWWMHPPLKQWLDAHPEAMPDAGIIFDIAVPRKLVKFAFVKPKLA